MRVTNQIMTNNTLANINTNKVNLMNIEEQYQTGKKIQRPSDDPIIAVRALKLRNNLTEIKQYFKKNVPDARSWMQTTESALKQITDMCTVLHSHANQGANGTLTAEDRMSIMKTMSQYRQQSGHKNILSIYCKNKSGDQGSRALITNLYGGTYTDKSHLSYTIDSQKNITAITSLISSYGISIDPTLSSADEINKFRHGELAVSICWNPSYHTDTSIGPAGKTSTGDEIIPMHFPSLSGASKLAGGIWGFGIFDNKDKNKIKAAKIFIDYMANDEDGVRAAVKASHVFPVHKELTNIYSGSKIGKAMDTFSRCFMLSMGDYYQVTPGWPEVRSLWYETLQGIAGGNDIRTSLADCNSKANTIANQVKAEMNKQD